MTHAERATHLCACGECADLPALQRIRRGGRSPAEIEVIAKSKRVTARGSLLLAARRLRAPDRLAPEKPSIAGRLGANRSLVWSKTGRQLASHAQSLRMTLVSQATETFTLDRLATPIGNFLLATDAASRVRAIDFDGDEARTTRHLLTQCGKQSIIQWGAAPAALTRALNDYFEGNLNTLNDVPCQADGTPFQQAVWSALRKIPAGQTISYGELARQLGNPNAMRAVGLANGSNPVPVIIPCHRVIGADGSLTGYGGGLERKRWLLAHEGRHSPLFSM